MDEIKQSLENLLKLIEKSKDSLILENLNLELEFLYKKYDKKINPKYKNKIELEKIIILFYNSGINVLLKKDFKEEILWEITKIIIVEKSYSNIKMRKDKDFSNTVMCSFKQLFKIKEWFKNNEIEYEILSLFYTVKNKEEIEKKLNELSQLK